MEAGRFLRTVSYHNTEDLNLNLHCHENLRSCNNELCGVTICCQVLKQKNELSTNSLSY
jgi:hypothetical protein